MTLKDSSEQPDTGASKTDTANGTDIPAEGRSKSPNLSSREKKRARAAAYRAANREKERARVAAYRAANREKRQAWQAAERAADPVKYLIYHAKRRAKKAGLPHSVTPNDIPDHAHCAHCKREVFTSVGAGRGYKDARTLDKLVPSLGYVAGNTFVLCAECNTIKGALTFDQFLSFAHYVSKNALPGSVDETLRQKFLSFWEEISVLVSPP
jgi:hypothetical protein